MSIVNLGLQCVGMMRREGSQEFERTIKHAKNLSQVHEASSKYKADVKMSVQPSVEFIVFDSASEDKCSLSLLFVFLHALPLYLG